MTLFTEPLLTATHTHTHRVPCRQTYYHRDTHDYKNELADKHKGHSEAHSRSTQSVCCVHCVMGLLCCRPLRCQLTVPLLRPALLLLQFNPCRCIICSSCSLKCVCTCAVSLLSVLQLREALLHVWMCELKIKEKNVL